MNFFNLLHISDHKIKTYTSFRLILYFIAFTIVSFLGLSSCQKSEPEPVPDYDLPKVENLESTVLIYAVASNSLNTFFRSDSVEMIMAADEIDLSRNAVMMYSVTLKRGPQLDILVKGKDGKNKFITLKKYDRSLLSTDKERIREVIDDAMSWSKTSDNGLILWSHATAWKYQEDTKPKLYDESTVAYAFGQDIDSDKTGYCNVTDLAEAIPNNIFNYIWFDCCYMSNIETYYQLREKAHYFVGSPTEMGADGMPYDLTLPYLAKKNPELVIAADKSFSKYNFENQSCTMAVIDSSYLDDFADLFRQSVIPVMYDGASALTELKTGLLDYSRKSFSLRLYDAPEFALRCIKKSSDYALETQLRDILTKLIVYKSATKRDFNNREIDTEQFNGFSCTIYDSQTNDYYRELEWFKHIWNFYLNPSDYSIQSTHYILTKTRNELLPVRNITGY